MTRRRKAGVALALCGGLAALSIPAAVLAGPASTQPNGNFLMIDTEVKPPRAGSDTTLRYHAFFGNRQGRLLPREARNEIKLAKGFRLRGRAFPKCPLPSDPGEYGQPRCSGRASVGEGIFEADARPTLDDPVSGSFQIYNGERRRGRTTLIFLAEAQVGNGTVRSEVDYRYARSTLRTLPPPEGTATGLFTLTKVSLTIGDKFHGKRYVRAPHRCKGSWRVRETSFFEGGGSITARDAAPCVRR